MRILAIADYEEGYLSEHFDRSRVQGVDLVISCGDLDPDYLEYRHASIRYVVRFAVLDLADRRVKWEHSADSTEPPMTPSRTSV